MRARARMCLCDTNSQEGAVFKVETRLKSSVPKTFKILQCAPIFILRLQPNISSTHTNKVKLNLTEIYSELFVLVFAY